MTCEICITHGKLCPMCEIKTLTEDRDLLQNELDVIKPFAEEAAKWLPDYNKTVAERDVLKEDNEKVYAALLDALSKLETSNRWVAKQAALIHKLKADLTNINHPKTR